MEKVLFSRHLDEIDDLETYGRDAPLVDTVKNREKIEVVSRILYEKTLRGRKKALMFVVSPRIRAQQTARLLAENVRKNGACMIKVRFSVNENLKATEQGEFILPKGYKPGLVFQGLKLAHEIFNCETHGSDCIGGVDNIDYKFGDPVQLPCGKYKYPELTRYFLKYGDSYRESLVRLYSTILEASKKYKKMLQNTEVVIVAHGQTYHVVRGLLQVGKMIKSNKIKFGKGDSVRLLWNVYKSCGDDQKVTGVAGLLDFSSLGDKDLMCILKEEIEFLKTTPV